MAITSTTNSLIKQCSTCREEKLLSGFAKRSGGRLGHRGQCRMCFNKNRKVYMSNLVVQQIDKGTKCCSVCKETKDITSFVAKKDTKCGRGSICKKCNSYRSRQWCEDNKDKRNANRYNLTTDEYYSIYKKQESKCGICGVFVKLGGKGHGAGYVDHCHNTGKVRGILCHNCNIAIGLLKDNITTLYSAIKYIKEGI